MDTFYYKHFVIVQFELFAALYALACWEVVARQLYLFTLEQRIKLFVEEREV